MSRVIVGTCQECGNNLRAKITGVKESMNLTCKCGAKNIVHPPNDLVLTAEEERTKKTNLAETSDISNATDGLFSDGLIGLLDKGPIGWIIFGLIAGFVSTLFMLIYDSLINN
ncbi:MAG: hypothetical protein M3H12_15905 [Chromatiales bacterium]|nr:hypothetical protein [Gammaproteobacteria bacterium]